MKHQHCILLLLLIVNVFQGCSPEISYPAHKSKAQELKQSFTPKANRNDLKHHKVLLQIKPDANSSAKGKKWMSSAVITVLLAAICLVVLIALGSALFSLMGLFGDVTFSVKAVSALLFGSGFQVLMTVGLLTLALFAIPLINGGLKLDLASGFQLALTIISGGLAVLTNYHKLRKARNEADTSEEDCKKRLSRSYRRWR